MELRVRSGSVTVKVLEGHFFLIKGYPSSSLVIPELTWNISL